MPLNRLPVAGSRNRVVRVDPNATNGAVVGENLFDAAGNVVDLDALIADAIANLGDTGATSPAGSDLTTDEVTEGRFNLYYTTERVDAEIAAHAKFPFFAADGSPAYIPLTSGLKLPFFAGDGSAQNIALAA